MKSIIVKTAMFALFTFAAVGALATRSAHAGQQCGSFPVTMVGVDNGGTVFASFPGLGFNLALCRVDATLGGWSAGACKALLSELNAALLSGKKIQPFWDAAKKPNCTVIPEWTNFSVSQGFYHAAFTN